MDKMVYQSFKNGTVRIVGEVLSIVRHLHPSAHGVVLNEVHAVFQKQNEVGSVFYRTDSVILIKSRPSGTEDA